MLQNFHFKIVNHANYKHAIVDVLSKNVMDKYKANEGFGNEIQDLAKIAQNASKPSFHEHSEIIINLFIILTREEKDHDVDHYEKGEELIAFKAETPSQVEIGQQLVVRKNK
jgi:hypothetical protein